MIVRAANRILALSILCAAMTPLVPLVAALADSVDTNTSAPAVEMTRTTSSPTKGPSDVAMPVANVVSAIPLAKLSMTRDRPIFSPSRRPPPQTILPVIARPMEPVKPAEPDRPPLILVGTVAGGDSGIAVFVEQSTENTIRLRVNESHQGWTLNSIHGREVTLRKERKSSVLALAPPGGNAEPARAEAYLDPVKKSPRR